MAVPEGQEVLMVQTGMPLFKHLRVITAAAGTATDQQRAAAAAQSESSGPEIFANFLQHAQQTNKGITWNTHN
jgi:hypothetical protein